MEVLILDLTLFVVDFQFWGRDRGHGEKVAARGEGWAAMGQDVGRKNSNNCISVAKKPANPL